MTHPDAVARRQQLDSNRLLCLLDLDGVVADFVRAAMELHEKEWPYDRIRGDEAWDILKHWDMSAEEFWNPLGYDFWRNMPKTPEADSVVDSLSRRLGRSRICFLSSPCLTMGCMEGKRDWVHEFYPDIPVMLSLSSKAKGSTPPKQFCASPQTLLIDDHTPNVDKFRSMGGHAFLVPRPWNRDHELEGGLVKELDDYLGWIV